MALALDIWLGPGRGCPRLRCLPQMLGRQEPLGLGIALGICRQQLQVPRARAPLAAMLRAGHPGRGPSAWPHPGHPRPGTAPPGSIASPSRALSQLYRLTPLA